MRGHYAVGFRWVESREKKGEGSAWLARLGAPLRRGEGGPGRRGKTLHQFFFRKISPTGLAIPFSRLRVSPAPETAHLLAAPLSGSRPAPWKPDSAMLCADRPALVARGDPNFELCRT